MKQIDIVSGNAQCRMLSRLIQKDPACCSDLYIQDSLRSPAAWYKYEWHLNVTQRSSAHSNETLHLPASASSVSIYTDISFIDYVFEIN